MKRKILVFFIFLNLIFPSVAYGFVFKMCGVSIASMTKINNVEIDGLNKINTISVNTSIPDPPLLYGFGGTPETEQGLNDIIGNLTLYGMNTYRISFTPDWAAGTRPWNATQCEYFLNNTDDSWFLIIDRNHQLESSTMDWAQANQSIYDDILANPNFANNPRVIIEIVNEFVYKAPDNVWDGCAPIVASIQADGYTNPLLVNKHSVSDDWAEGAVIPFDYYGHHMYMSNDNASYTQQTYWQGQNETREAENAGCVPGVNTEVGAHHLEFNSFDQVNVDLLKDYILWSRNRPVPFGNIIWMNKDMRNLETYLTYNLFDGL